MRRAALLVNTGSRRGAEWYEEAAKKLAERGLEPEIKHICDGVPDLLDQVRGALQAGVELLIVGGGDGTLGAVAGELRDSDVVMGVLPMGTGNALARDLHLDSIDDAIDAIVQGRELEIDLGVCNDRIFVNLASIGVSTEIAEGLSDSKKLMGKLTYLPAAFKALVDAEAFRLEIEVDGEAHAMDAFQVVVANGRTHAGPFVVSPDAHIADCQLSVYVIEETNKANLLKFGVEVARGAHTDMDIVKTWEAERVRISCAPTMEITLDGETCQRTPAVLEVVPRGLRVMTKREQMDPDLDSSLNPALRPDASGEEK